MSETHSRLKIFECLGKDDVEDGVRPTALLVHVGGSNRPGLVALRHQRLNVLLGGRKSHDSKLSCNIAHFIGSLYTEMLHQFFTL